MRTTIDPVVLGEAVTYAAQEHADQPRKRATGDDRPPIPYITHPLAVAGLVIEKKFGADVLAIVRGCSGPKKEDPGMADFRIRKQVYLDHLAGNPAELYAAHAAAGCADPARAAELGRLVRRMGDFDTERPPA